MSDTEMILSPPKKKLKQSSVASLFEKIAKTTLITDKKQDPDIIEVDKDEDPIDNEKENETPEENGQVQDDVPSSEALNAVENDVSISSSTNSPDSKLNPKKRVRENSSKRKSVDPEKAKLKEIEKAKRDNLKKEKESEKKRKREEREAGFAENKRKREQEKQLKAELAEKGRKELEEKRKLDQEEKERKKAEREEKKRIKDELEKQKEEEKRLEKEEKERKKSEEEKKEIEKLEKGKMRMEKFFGSKRRVTTTTIAEKNVTCDRWSRFQLRENQIKAPVTYWTLEENEIKKLEESLHQQNDKTNILTDLKSRPKRKRPGYKKQTKKDEDCVMINDELELALKNGEKMKFLQFQENIRPAYYGTHRKKSKLIRPRNPIAKDSSLDYTEDSGDDWEEEPDDAEVIGGKDEEKMSDDEEEMVEEGDGFFVPHGYLSSDEEQLDKDEEPDLFQSSSERIKQKQITFEKMRKKKLRRLTTVIQNVDYENHQRFNWETSPIIYLNNNDIPELPINPYKDYSEQAKAKLKSKKDKEEKDKKKKEESERLKAEKVKAAEVKLAEVKLAKEAKLAEEAGKAVEVEIPAPKTPKTPKTPKVSMLSFVKKTDVSDLRSKLFDDSNKAAQRQAEQKKILEQKKIELDKKIEAEKKIKEEAAKLAKDAETKINSTEKTQSATPVTPKINLLTPKRKKKPAKKVSPKVKPVGSSPKSKVNSKCPVTATDSENAEPIVID